MFDIFCLPEITNLWSGHKQWRHHGIWYVCPAVRTALTRFKILFTFFPFLFDTHQHDSSSCFGSIMADFLCAVSPSLMFAWFLPGTIRTFNHDSVTYLLYNDHLILKRVSISSALPMKHLPVMFGSLGQPLSDHCRWTHPALSVPTRLGPPPYSPPCPVPSLGGGYKYLWVPSLSLFVITNNHQISFKLKSTLMRLVLLLLLPPDGGKVKVIDFDQFPILSNFPLNFPFFF